MTIYSLGGFKFNDTNNNGYFDAGVDTITDKTGAPVSLDSETAKAFLKKYDFCTLEGLNLKFLASRGKEGIFPGMGRWFVKSRLYSDPSKCPSMKNLGNPYGTDDIHLPALRSNKEFR